MTILNSLNLPSNRWKRMYFETRIQKNDEGPRPKYLSKRAQFLIPISRFKP